MTHRLWQNKSLTTWSADLLRQDLITRNHVRITLIFLTIAVRIRIFSFAYIWCGHLDTAGQVVSRSPEPKVQRLMSSDSERWSVMRADKGDWAESHTAQAHSLGCEWGGETPRRGGQQWPKVYRQAYRHICFSFTNNTRKGAFVSEIYVSPVWFPRGHTELKW